MTNFEYYKEEIATILNNGHTPMLHNGIPGSCNECDCLDNSICDLYDETDCSAAFLKWLYAEHIEKPKLTKKEKQFCELVETGWICRDALSNLWWFKERPEKSYPNWTIYDKESTCNDITHLSCKFSFITWYKEPWSVEELLKLEVEE